MAIYKKCQKKCTKFHQERNKNRQSTIDISKRRRFSVFNKNNLPSRKKTKPLPIIRQKNHETLCTNKILLNRINSKLSAISCKVEC